MNAISKLAIAGVITLSSVSLAAAQHTQHAGTAHQAGVAGQMAEGEVKKIDKETGKITLRHGELKDLGMPPMTMLFRVKDPAMLDQVKTGDKVKFIAEKVNGSLTIVRLETAK
jgi:Cu(I)/Ag(I) efflux system protein CusF